MSNCVCEEPPPNWYPKFGTKCNPECSGDSVVGTWLGWIASASVLGLFMSPIPSVVMPIIKNKTVGQYPDMPYLVALVNCVLWILYAIPQKLVQPLAINGLGAALNICWISVFLIYHEHKPVFMAKIAAVIAVCAATYAVGAIVDGNGGDGAAVIGDIADIFNIGMYGAPLAAVGTVVATRSVETLPIIMVLMCVVASAMWGTYAKWIGDYHVGIPNDIGVLLGLLQVIVWLKYRNATPIDLHDKLAEGGAKVADASQA